MDAFVDAYLFRFDDIMDLTFMVIPTQEGMSFGIHYSF
jgi:hypothetical protein